MQIPLTVFLFLVEFLLLFMVLSGFLFFKWRKLKKLLNNGISPDEVEEQKAVETPPTPPATAYIDYLQQETERTRHKQTSVDPLDLSDTDEASTDQHVDTTLNGQQRSKLLDIRLAFLKAEKDAIEMSGGDEDIFWPCITESMRSILSNCSAEPPTLAQVETSNATEDLEDALNAIYDDIPDSEPPIHTPSDITDDKETAKEKITYIERHSKNINQEMNQLKDILAEQQNLINKLKNGLGASDDDIADISSLTQQLEALMRSNQESNTCIEVLELENERLQAEIDELKALPASAVLEQEVKLAVQLSDSLESSGENIQELKGMVDEQAGQVHTLNELVEALEIEPHQTRELMHIFSEFTQGSLGMLNCVSQLERENKSLKSQVNSVLENNDTSSGDETVNENPSQEETIKALEQEIIKKDIAYAELQTQFETMEKEYLAMYEEMQK